MKHTIEKIVLENEAEGLLIDFVRTASISPKAFITTGAPSLVNAPKIHGARPMPT